MYLFDVIFRRGVGNQEKLGYCCGVDSSGLYLTDSWEDPRSALSLEHRGLVHDSCKTSRGTSVQWIMLVSVRAKIPSNS